MSAWRCWSSPCRFTRFITLFAISSGFHGGAWLTLKFLNRYFNNRAYYELNSHAKIDNPDQRIAEDVGTFTQKSLYFC